MIRNFSLTNETDSPKEPWIEPECFDYWLIPGQTFKIQVDETADDSTSDLDHREGGWTLFPSGGAECVTCFMTA